MFYYNKILKQVNLAKIKNVIILCFLLLLTSCIEKEKYSNIPEIKYVSFVKIGNETGADAQGILKISFTDGDGDVGLDKSDTLGMFSRDSIYYNNFFIKYFEKQNGVITEIELPFAMHSRIPMLTPQGKNKALKGEIEIKLFINNPVSQFDTILFEAFIVDRALNKSNTIITPEIKINK